MSFLNCNKRLLYFVTFFISIVYSMEENKSNFIDKLYPGNPGKPLYAIAIARETHDDADYPKFKQDECDLVFNALRFVLNQKNKLSELLENQINNKTELLNKGLEIYSKKYVEFDRFIEFDEVDNSSMDVLFQYLKHKKDFDFFFNDDFIKKQLVDCKSLKNFTEVISNLIDTKAAEIALLIQSSQLTENIKKQYVGEKSLTTTKSGNKDFVIRRNLKTFLSRDKISKFFCETFEEQLKTMLNKEMLNYDEFLYLKAKFKNDNQYFKKENEEKSSFLNQFGKMKNRIANSNYLVVFNEMFFGKSWNKDLYGKNSFDYAPLSYQEFSEISDQIVGLSKITNAIFHVNFLSVDKEINGHEYKELVEKQQSILSKKSPEILKSFFDESHVIWETLLSKIEHKQQYKTFKNESLIYSQGNVLNSYRKLSYKDEGNALLESVSPEGNGALYLFGTGQGEKYGESETAEAINNYLSTEICFDLKIGVRKRLNNHPHQGKLHIVVSNTLPFPLTDPSIEVKENFDHFPENIPLILHVDPHEQDLFVRGSSSTFFLDKHYLDRKTSKDIYKTKQPKNLAIHDPLYSFQLGIGKNVFTFKIWNINSTLEKLNEY